MFSYAFCEIFKNPFSYRTSPLAACGYQMSHRIKFYISGAYSEPCETSIMSLKPLTIFVKIVSLLDV